MNNYVEKWIKIMEKNNFKSTYQVVFGKAILEAVNCFVLSNEESDSEFFSIPMHEIVRAMMWLYWKQSFKYNLKQGDGNLKIITLIDEIIEKFNDEFNEERETYSLDLDFIVPEDFFSTDNNRRNFWDSKKRQIQRIISRTIIPAFMNNGDEILDFFVEDNDVEIVFRKKDIIALKEHYMAVKYIYDYKWAQLLSRYNEDFKLDQEMIKLIDLRIYD